jgi:hypothetical protein
VELVATIAILAAVSLVSSGIIMQASDGYVEAKATSQLHTEMSIAMDRALREIRAIALDTGASGVAPNIDSTTKTSLVWEGDSSLTMSGDNLVLTIDNDGGHVLLTDVTDLTIRTYDESNTQLGAGLSGTGCDAIRRVSVSITVQRHGVTHTLRGRVFLRCASQPTGE